MKRYGMALVALAVSGGAAAQEAPRPAPGAGQSDTMVELGPRERVRVFTSRRARLGVSVNLRAEKSDSIGALLLSVTPNSPAARAGLQSGDIITHVNGQPLVGEGFKVGVDQSAPGLRLIELAAVLDPGDTVRLGYRRDATRRTATVVAGDEPAFAWRTPDGGTGYVYGTDPEAAAEAFRRSQEEMARALRHASPPEAGMGEMRSRAPYPPRGVFLRGGPLAELELAPMNSDLGRYFGTAEGVLVIRAPADSRLGLKGGDVVVSVDGRPVASPGQLIRILGSYEGEEQFRMEVMRMKKKETVQGKVGE